MNHCINCLHWDEEKADKWGRAPCAPLFEEFAASEAGGTLSIVAYLTDGDCMTELRTRGDFGCALFEPKLAHPRSTP